MNVGGRGSTAHKLEEDHFESCVRITSYCRSGRGFHVKGLTRVCLIGVFRYRVEQHKGVNGELTVVMIKEVHVEVGCGLDQDG